MSRDTKACLENKAEIWTTLQHTSQLVPACVSRHAFNISLLCPVTYLVSSRSLAFVAACWRFLTLFGACKIGANLEELGLPTMPAHWSAFLNHSFLVLSYRSTTWTVCEVSIGIVYSCSFLPTAIPCYFKGCLCMVLDLADLALTVFIGV